MHLQSPLRLLSTSRRAFPHAANLEKKLVQGEDMKDGGVVFAPASAATLSAPEPGMRRQVLAYNQKVMLVRHHFSKGWKGESHSHPHEQLVYVVTGRILFTGGGRVIEMRSGESIVVEGDVEHQATALEDSEVLDVFVPCRGDYLQCEPHDGD